MEEAQAASTSSCPATNTHPELRFRALLNSEPSEVELALAQVPASSPLRCGPRARGKGNMEVTKDGCGRNSWPIRGKGFFGRRMFGG